MVIAGIVLFNPAILRLKLNIEGVYNQVDKIVLIDNGSENINEIEALISNYYNCVLILNEINKGIATALNQIVCWAKEIGAKWVLTLDQDSICYENLIENYLRYTNEKDVALMTCIIQDRNFKLKNDEEHAGEKEYIKSCITSGSFLNVEACLKIGGFDEALFIDKVDTDICLRLVISGFKILRINFNGLLHEVGNGTSVKNIFGKEVVVFNHSPFRCYYIIRNQIYFARKHKAFISNYLKTYFAAYNRILIFLLFETDKFKKVKVGFKGLIDGHRMPINKI